MGGDTDSVAMMAGALAGARWGDAWVPAGLLDGLEEGAVGRVKASALAICDLGFEGVKGHAAAANRRHGKPTPSGCVNPGVCERAQNDHALA